MARPRADGLAPRKAKHVHLTDAFLKSMETPDRRVIFYDKALKGFCLQAEPSGHRSWKFHYRIGGRPRWYHLADFRKLPDAKAIPPGPQQPSAEAEHDQQQVAGIDDEPCDLGNDEKHV